MSVEITGTPDRRRFSWAGHTGSVWVTTHGKTLNGWGRVTVTGDKLPDIAEAVFGRRYDAINDQGGYQFYKDVTPYELADLICRADQLLGKG